MFKLRPLILFCLFIQAITVSTVNSMCCRRSRSAQVQAQSWGSQAKKSMSGEMLNDRLSSAIECGTMVSAAVASVGAAGFLIAKPDAPTLVQVSVGFLGVAASAWGIYVGCRFVGERSKAYVALMQEYSGMPIRHMVSLEPRNKRLKRSKSAEPKRIRSTSLVTASSPSGRTPVGSIGVALRPEDNSVSSWRVYQPGRTVVVSGDSVIHVSDFSRK